MADSNGTPIDKLSIEIGASSTKAINNINRLADTLRDLRHAMNYETGDTAKKLSKIAKALNSLKDASSIRLNSKLPSQLRELGETISTVSDETIRKLDAMTAAIERLKGIDLKGFSSAVKAAKKASGQMTALQEVKKQPTGMSRANTNIVPSQQNGLVPVRNTSDKDIHDMLNRDFFGKNNTTTVNMSRDFSNIGEIIKKNIGPALSAAGTALSKMVKNARKLGMSFAKITWKGMKSMWDHSAVKKIEDGINHLKKVMSTFGRIAFYRAVRSAIKYVTDALKEGVDNAYWFAREFGNATRYIADAYDQMSSSNFKMSNQLGAAWATLIATIQPIIQKIIALVTKAANILTQFFALLGGKSTYLKAIDYNKQWAESAGGAAKAAEEWKNQLMGFDEINRLEEPSDGGGGGGGGLPDYENMFEEAPLDSPLFDQIKDMINSGKWEELGQMLGEKVNTLVNSIDFKAIGKVIGEKINNAIRLSYSFLNTVDFQNIGKKIADLLNNAMAGIDFNKLGRLRVRIKTALWDVIYGAVISVDWARVAVSISDYLIGAMNELAGWISGLDAGEIAKAFDDFFGNVKWDEIADAAVNLLKTAFQKLKDILVEADVSGALSNIGGLIKTVINDGIMNTDFAELHNILSYKIDAAVFGDKWANFWWGHGDYAGKEIISGLIEGTKTKQKDLEAQMEDVSQSTVDVTERMLDIHSPSKVFYNIGVNLIQGLLNGISQMWGKFTSSFQGLWNGLQKWWSSLTLSPIHIPHPHFEWTYKEATGLIAKAMEWAGLNPQIPELNISWYAKGGFPEDGLFMANHGELVGEFSNGRTAVANNEQITEGISHAVYNAFMTAFSQTGGSSGDSREVRIYLDGREIAKSTTKYQRQMARAGGV